MKIGNMPGEFGFKALVRARHTATDADGKIYADSWGETTGFFFSREEVEAYYSVNDWDIKWPVEMQEGRTVYVPALEELA